MQPWDIFLLILGIVGAVLGIVAFLVPALVKRDLDLMGVIQKATGALGSVGAAVGGLQAVFPDLQGLDTVEKIMLYAQEAVETVEQLFRAGNLKGEERKKAATAIIYDMLAVAKIEVTPKIERIVNACIEAAVFALPKMGAGGNTA